jgi:hypothetical protein
MTAASEDQAQWYDSIAMTPGERADFLHTYTMGVFSTVRKSGAPFGIPLGFLLEQDVFDNTTPVYLALGGRRTLIDRLRRDPRICMTVDNMQIPTAGIIAEGIGSILAKEEGDALIARWFGSGNISDKMSDEVDAEAFRKRSLEVDRTAVRIDFNKIISWNSRKRADWDKAPAVHAAGKEHRERGGY